MEVLEARLLLSADLPGLSLDPAALGQTPAAREVVVLDSGLPDLGAMRTWLGADAPQAEVLVLHAGQDALEQIGRHLAQGDAVGAVHLLTHGSPGSLTFGGSVLDATALAAYAGELGDWNLAPCADLLLYGCDVASGPNGEAFLDMLAQFTGADIAGSVDLTGHPDVGGDWTLEVRVGDVDSATIAGPRLSRMWRAALSEVPAETLADGSPVVLGEAVAPEWFAGEDGSASQAPVPAGTVVPAAGGTSLIGTTAPAQTVNETRREAVFVDASLPDLDTLLADMAARPGTRIFLVDPTADGLDVITRTLADEGITWDAIHLLGHGAPGSLTLGSARLDAASLAGRAAVVASWSTHLGEDADLLLYSCDTGARSEGLALIDALAGLTGADVAASDDRTGHASLGGDWSLEVSRGRIETGALLSEVATQSWRHILPQYTVADNFDVAAYNVNNGTANWATDWLENDDGGDGATVGFIRINGGKLLIGSFNENDAITRFVNLAGATSAVLTFSFNGTLDPSDDIRLEVWESGAGWLQKQTYSGFSAGFESVDLLPHASSNTAVRFRIENISGGGAILQVDDFLITYDVPAANTPPTVTAPPSFTVTEDQAGNLVYTGTPFTDADNDPLTVTLSIADGVIAGTSGGGVTVGGSATARTFSGSVANLNTYFTTAGNITYTTAANNTQARTLTTDVSDGVNADFTDSLISITPANDSPVLDPAASPTLGSVSEGETSPAGIQISGLIDAGGGQVTDPDGTTVEAIAIVGLDTSLGTWQYSLNGGTSWLTIDAPAINSTTNELALLLGPTARIRLLRFGDLNGTLSDAITFRAWDMSSGVSGSYVVITNPGIGTSAFSAASDTASITVTAVNDAPSFSLGDGIVTTPIGPASDDAYSVVVQPDGRIVVAGTANAGMSADIALVRYDTDGALDTSFGTGGKVTTAVGIADDAGFGLALQPDGKLLLAGRAWNGSNYDFALVRYNADGTLDAGFGTGGKVTLAIGSNSETGYSVTVQTDGKIVVVGSAHMGMSDDIAVARFNADGTPDSSFGSGGRVTLAISASIDVARDVAVQPDGRILVGGWSSSGGLDYVFALLRYNADGTLDTSFSGDGIATVNFGPSTESGYGLALQPDGKIVVAGEATIGGNTDFALARFNADGTLDTGFGTGGLVTTPIGAGYDAGRGVTVQQDGRILVAGQSRVGSADVFALARYNANGTLDAGFGTAGIVTTAIAASDDEGYDVVVQADGRIVVVGRSYDGTQYDFAAVRYQADGSLDPTFSPTATLGGTVAFTEGGSPVVLDSNVRVFDAELSPTGAFSGATLTLARSGGASAQDQFSATGTLGVLTEGGALVVGGTTIGTVTTNSGGTLVLSFGAGTTNALVDSAMQQIAYANSSDAPPASVQIDWTFSDGNAGGQGSGGALTASGSTTVNITAVNDAPVITSGATASFAENGSGTAYTVTATDAEGSTLTYAIVGGDEAWAFAIDSATGAVSFVSPPNFENPLDTNPDNVYEVLVTASDGLLTSAPSLVQISVTDVGTYYVTTAADSGAGSLRAAITAANATPNADGVDRIVFAIPGTSVHTITLVSELPTITESVVIDGTTQAVFAGVSPPLLGTGGVVGTEGLALDRVAQPYLQVSGGGALESLLRIEAPDVTVRGLSLFGSYVHDIGLGIGAHRALIERNLIGSAAAAFADPGAGARSAGMLVNSGGADNVVIRDNLLGYSGAMGLYLSFASDDWVIDGNEIRGTGQVQTGWDAITIRDSVGTVVQGNLVTATQGGAIRIEKFSFTTNEILIYGNTFSSTALGPGASPHAIGVGTDTQVTIQQNVISTATGDAIRVVGSSAEATITRNAISGSSGLGIDLATLGDLPGTVTANDAGDPDTGGGNDLQNFPVLSSAVTTPGVGTTISGTLNSTPASRFRIEFFSSPAADPSGHGEGSVYLGFTVVDTDAGGDASFSAALPFVEVTAGHAVSATATVQEFGGTLRGTSEFSATISATSGNSPPVLNAAFSPTLDSVAEGTANPAGLTVAALVVDGSITDADGGAVEAIAITALNTSLGTWQYSLDGGTDWLTMDAPAINSSTNELALLLGPTARIRLLPFGDLNGTVGNGIIFHAWDMSTGTSGSYVVITSPGVGTSAFSAINDTASISVTAVNDAPTFAPVAGTGRLLVPVGASEDYGSSMTVQPDGRILVAGYSSNGSNYDFSLIRLNADGSLDTTFDSDGKLLVPVGASEDYGNSVTVQPDGRILVAGYSSNGSNDDFSLIRLNADGSLDTTFGADGKLLVPVGSGEDYGYSVTVQPDGRILLAGASQDGVNNDFSLIRLNADGSLDTSFDTDGKLIVPVGSGHDVARSVTVQADGRILVAGRSHNGSNDDFSLIRLNADGSLDTTFDADGKLLVPVGSDEDYGYSVTVQPDGRILLAGGSPDGSNYEFSLIRLNADGSLDATFDSDGKLLVPVGSGTDIGTSVTVQPDGRILVAGHSWNGSNNDFSLIRLNADGSLDTSFDTDGKLLVPVGSGNDYGSGITVQPDGKIVVAGYSHNGSDDDFSLIRLNPDGSLDTTFNGPATNTLGGTVAYTENGSPVVLDSDVAIFDADLSATNFSGATLTLARNGGSNGQDQFSATGTLGALTQGSALVVDGTAIGTVTTNGGGTLVLTFGTNATNALVNSAMQQIAYANTSDAPPASVQIDWTFSDGNAGAQGSGGALTDSGVTTVNITPTDDRILLFAGEEPTLGTVAEGARNHLGITVADFVVDGSIEDPDGPVDERIAIAAVDTSLGTWQVSLDGGTVWLDIDAAALNSQADLLGLLLGPTARIRLLPSGDLNGTLNSAITFHAWDGNGGSEGDYVSISFVGPQQSFSSMSDTAPITVTPVNDPPRLLYFSLSMPLGGSRILAAPDFPIEDLDGQVGSRFVDVSGLTGARFELTSAPDVAITSFSFDQVVAGAVRLVHTDAQVVPVFDVVVRDGANAGTAVEAVISLVPPPADDSGLLAAAAGSGSSTPTPVGPQPPATPPVTEPPKPEPAEAGVDASPEAESNVVLTMPVPRVPPQTRGQPVPADTKAPPVVQTPQLPAMAYGPAALTLAPVGGPVMTSGATVRADLTVAEPLPEAAPLEDDIPAEVSVAWLPSEENATAREKTAEEQQVETVVTGVRMASVGLSVGVVSWVLRAGGIASSLLAGVPAWRYLDPLPILERSRLPRVVWRDDLEETLPEEPDDDEQEDQTARPAKGTAGRVLDQMLGGGP